MTRNESERVDDLEEMLEAAEDQTTPTATAERVYKIDDDDDVVVSDSSAKKEA
jgi:hypothetical protein